MQITLYNTCPAEYEKKFIQILKRIIKPALKQGRSVKVDEISEENWHNPCCRQINDKRFCTYRDRYKRECSGCIKKVNFLIQRKSDLTMKIQIGD